MERRSSNKMGLSAVARLGKRGNGSESEIKRLVRLFRNPKVAHSFRRYVAARSRVQSCLRVGKALGPMETLERRPVRIRCDSPSCRALSFTCPILFRRQMCHAGNEVIRAELRVFSDSGTWLGRQEGCDYRRDLTGRQSERTGTRFPGCTFIACQGSRQPAAVIFVSILPG